MKKNNVGVLAGTMKLALLAAVCGMLAGSVARASDVACTNPQTLATTGNTVVGSGNGCTAVNANFQNFNVTDSGTTTDFPTPASGGTANIEFTSNGTASPTATLDFTTTSINAGSAACVTNSWCVSEGTHTGAETTSFFVQPTGHIYDIGLTIPAINDGTINTGSTISVEEQFCLGAATVASCTAADSGFLEISSTNATGTWVNTYTVCTPGAVTCTQTHPASAPTIGFAGQTEIAISDTVTITTATGTRGVFLDSFDNTFGETPEPSTFVLLGSSLVGLGFMRWKRRRA